MGKGRTTINQPKPIDPGQAMGKYLFGSDFENYSGVTDPRLQERLIGAEERFRPRYAALELKDIATFARGTRGTPGLFDLLAESGERASEIQRKSLQAQREADVAAIQEFAPQLVEAYREADPASTALAEQTTARALGQLTPDEERDIQQQARMGSLARGRTGDASSIFGEALGRRQFSDRYTAPAFQMNRAIAGDIGMSILGRPSQGLAMGGNVLGQAQGQAAGPMGPQLFDPNAGINLALQQRSQDMSLLGAQAQADATRSAGQMGMMGKVAGAFIGGPSGMASAIFG